MTGIVILLVALAAATAFGLHRRATDGRSRATDGSRAPHLTRDDLGADLGTARTFVQFSSSVCTPCRRTRTLLESVTAERPDVAYVDLDAESRLDLADRFGVLRTPTVLVLDPDGAVAHRIVGQPRRADVLALLEPSPEPPVGAPTGATVR
ncbi:thioredoxin family protein [Raineyella sp. W15-4]|uniref:TlpA family protein disulfide reductase n=1 Tax=Raineyella sp. W15-4 TaxID=3081651 RepID=UPI0029532CAE|nr:thioredoxin family protein [Raineyella sp. W15-4]WOQ17757.1 thioredoxin family protein [Raineyella sp. W15-4]